MLLATACGAPSTDLDEAENTSSSSTTPAADDVNGDGYTDLPISGRTGDPETGQPYVGVLLGGPDGLSPDRSVTLTREDLGLADDGELLTVLDTGDLDGDGYTDLLVDAGSGYVVWGGPDGPSGEAQPLPWLEMDDPRGMYAVSLVVGDFDGDGNTDVTVLDHLQGSPMDEFETTFHRGPFERDGSAAESREVTLPSDAADAELDVIDADGDAALDLLLVRNRDESPAPHLVLRSGPDGPAQEVVGDTGLSHAYANGDFDGDAHPDLLIGVSGIPNNEPGHEDELHPGYVDAYAGGDGFLDAEPNRLTLDSEGVPGEAEDGDGFGNGLLVGDVDGDGYDDAVAMTGPFHSHETATLLFGGPEGLTGERAAALTVPERGDLGSYHHHALADYDGDGHPDLLLSTVRPSMPEGVTGYVLFPGGPGGFDQEPVEFTTEGL
ncbi:VCBS repeat-containing protein [Nocardiopsis sp. L17-MgMaSL7]|uniref:FG-GAP repeat domain-containing protein n=1 Tax=Nocardiopsis sp. L17-MgMaSL7 TaxID=1938893 RepID=UPI000D70C31A|nr:VCBS repeat-containing protein [Nocardiopsis sp. L17-MgMaSL7]PWV55198.1 VCBS repeat protein [Nocardiopsis sp. L17-MgMaSL7]